MATTLRRRVFGDGNGNSNGADDGNDTASETPTETPTPTPRDDSPNRPARNNSKGKKDNDHHHRPHRPKTRKRKTTAIFLLGSLFGIIAAGFFAKSNDLIEFPEIGELSMDSLFDVLPAGLVKDMRELVVSFHCIALKSHRYLFSLSSDGSANIRVQPPERRTRLPRELRCL